MHNMTMTKPAITATTIGSMVPSDPSSPSFEVSPVSVSEVSVPPMSGTSKISSGLFVGWDVGCNAGIDVIELSDKSLISIKFPVIPSSSNPWSIAFFQSEYGILSSSVSIRFFSTSCAAVIFASTTRSTSLRLREDSGCMCSAILEEEIESSSLREVLIEVSAMLQSNVSGKSNFKLKSTE